MTLQASASFLLQASEWCLCRQNVPGGGTTVLIVTKTSGHVSLVTVTCFAETLLEVV